MKILVVSPKNKTVFNFRGDLIRDMISCGHSVYVTGPTRDFYDKITALGISGFYEIPLFKDKISVRGDLAYFRALRRVMRELEPDMVFAYNIKPVIYGSLAAKSAGVKRIYSLVAGLGRVYASVSPKAKLIRFITNLLYRAAFACNDRVMFQNPTDIEDMISYHCIKLEKTALVNGSGVNMERFARCPFPPKITFLMVGRIIREKGVLDYCAAAKTVKERYPETRIVLLGAYDAAMGGLDPDEIKPYIDSGIIEFPGEKDDPVPLYRQSSVFVLPSYYKEGLPRSLLEAMSCGRPIITTDWPGCREPVEDGKNGWLVPVKDPKALAEAMCRMLEEPSLIEQMGESSYLICKEKYDVRIVNAQMREVMGYGEKI